MDTHTLEELVDSLAEALAAEIRELGELELLDRRLDQIEDAGDLPGADAEAKHGQQDP